MADKIKVGVVGNGGISGEHLGAYAKNPDVEIWALCDINEERLNRRPAAGDDHLPAVVDDGLGRRPAAGDIKNFVFDDSSGYSAHARFS